MKPTDPPSSICIVCCDMSQNALGRALVLAEVAQRVAPTRIVGVQRRATLWSPAQNSPVAMKIFPFRSTFDFRAAARWLSQETANSQVVISKPRMTSLGLARRAGLDLSRAVLDIDDWELGCMLPRGGLGQELPPNHRPAASTWFRALDKGINAPVVLHAMEKLALRVPTRLVSNSWLQKRFGGALLPHLRDTESLAPNANLRAQAREELKLDDKVWVSFVGTARSHKGIEELITAIERTPSHVGLLLCGIDRNDADGRRAAELAETRIGRERTRIIAPFQQRELQRLLSASDIAAVPSQRSAAAMGQIPAKLFDALSMGLPLITTTAGCIPEVVGDAGRVVEPGNIDELAAAIDELGGDKQLRDELGSRARARAVELYDLRVGVPIMEDALANAARVKA